ncbi:hypothetical protein [Gallaecimonas sp. GXIMD4217]|uniref:hypothetical protein n=1 Tax=Gallaecimonas sp. GXIMD4217 TaxID=3131927 RepID=UPI00311AFC79
MKKLLLIVLVLTTPAFAADAPSASNNHLLELANEYGAITSGFFALLGVAVGFFLQALYQWRKEREQLKGTLAGIKCEIEELIAIYQEKMGYHLATHQGEYLDDYWPLGDGYFTFYDNNAAGLSGLKDQELRKAVVRFYIVARGHLDSFRFNNQLLEKYSFLNMPNASGHERAATRRELVDYCSALKSSHEQMVSQAKSLIPRLEKEL